MNDVVSDLDRPLPPRSFIRRLGGMVTQPLRTFRALQENDDAHPLEPFIAYVLVLLGIHAAETYRLIALASDAPLIVLRRFVDLVLRAGRTDLGIVVIAALIAGGIATFRGGRFARAATATTYLLVPLTVLKAIGGALSVGGIDLWALPHTAVDSLAVIVGRHIDPVRIVVKSLVAYGPGLAVLLTWLATMKRPSRSPGVMPARLGAAILATVTVVLALGASADVMNRIDRLRPKLSGDEFPSVVLPLLDGTGTLDVRSLVGEGKAKVMIVDFWASWCGPCKRSLPELSALSTEFKDKGLVIIGVNREPSDKEAARASWKAIAPAFDSVVDSKGLGERVGLTSLPSSYVVDRSGRIRHLHLGYTDPDKVKAEVEALLAQ